MENRVNTTAHDWGCKIYPDRKDCRGCGYSLAPELFDGGCTFYKYEALAKGGATDGSDPEEEPNSR